jgi:methyl-accepting chemotaxis protein
MEELMPAEPTIESYERIIETLAKGDGKPRDLSARIAGDDPVASSIDGLIGDFESFASDALRHASKVAGAVSVLDGDVSALDEAIARQRERIVEAASLARDRSADIDSMARAAEAARLESSDSSRRAEENEAFMRKLVSELAAVDGHAAALDDISERLRVLAINTAIEAARAGAAGKGFAVIAKEVQRLSAVAVGETKATGDRVAVLRRGAKDMSSTLMDSLSSVERSLKDSTSIVARCREIREGSKRLDEALSGHARAVGSQRAASSETAAALEAIGAEADSVAERARSADKLAAGLREVVDAMLERIGTCRTSLHRRALDDLRALLAEAGGADGLFRDPDAALRARFESHPWFELLYAMDAGGTQISGNIVNPKQAGAVSSEGRGRSWRDKPYFAAIAGGAKSYASDIYVSVASGRLCLTLSVPLVAGGRLAGALAADMNIEDATSLASA